MKLRVGVVGVGVGKKHIEGYGQHPDCEVVAICARSRVRLDPVADQYGIENRYLSLEAMLSDANLDILSVASPNKLHKDMTLLAFEAGCHVLCEKPPAMNAAETAEMIEAARLAGKRLAFNFSFRFTEASQAAHRLVVEGALGHIYFARSVWHRRRGVPWWYDREGTGMKELNGGGPLVDLGVHRMDLAMWLMGYPRPVWVMGATHHEVGSALAEREGRTLDVEDMGNALIRLDDGACLSLEASWAANVKEREHQETILLGSRGGLVQHNVNNEYVYATEAYLDRAGELEDVTFSYAGKSSNPKLCAMYHFVDSIVKDVPHMCNGEEGLILMQTLDAIYRSAQSGEPVRISAADKYA